MFHHILLSVKVQGIGISSTTESGVSVPSLTKSKGCVHEKDERRNLDEGADHGGECLS